jgi:hypothetical protein
MGIARRHSEQSGGQAGRRGERINKSSRICTASNLDTETHPVVACWSDRCSAQREPPTTEGTAPSRLEGAPLGRRPASRRHCCDCGSSQRRPKTTWIGRCSPCSGTSRRRPPNVWTGTDRRLPSRSCTPSTRAIPASRWSSHQCASCTHSRRCCRSDRGLELACRSSSVPGGQHCTSS